MDWRAHLVGCRGSEPPLALLVSFVGVKGWRTAVAPRTASTAVAIAIVSLLLRFMADPFLTRISIFVPGSGTAYQTRILDPPKRSFFSGTRRFPREGGQGCSES